MVCVEVEVFGLLLFVKFVRVGLSVGVLKVDVFDEFDVVLVVVFVEDDKVLIEIGVYGREIEVVVFEGVDGVCVLFFGEIVLIFCGFYDFEGKYFGGDGVDVVCFVDVMDVECVVI